MPDGTTPEVVGSNPTSAIYGNLIAVSHLRLALTTPSWVEIDARSVSELAGACRCADEFPECPFGDSMEMHKRSMCHDSRRGGRIGR